MEAEDKTWAICKRGDVILEVKPVGDKVLPFVVLVVSLLLGCAGSRVVNGFGFWNKFSSIFKHLPQENCAYQNVFCVIFLFPVIYPSCISQIVKMGKEILE